MINGYKQILCIHKMSNKPGGGTQAVILSVYDFLILFLACEG